MTLVEKAEEFRRMSRCWVNGEEFALVEAKGRAYLGAQKYKIGSLNVNSFT